MAVLVIGALAPFALDGASAQGDQGQARSVIFYLGDGMGLAQREAGRLVTVGAYGTLVMDRLPFYGMAGTNAVDPETYVTDSAAGATSLASGVKTFNGAIGVDAAGQTVATIAELAKAAGKSVGIVTTSQVSDASGAAFGAHVQDRSDQSEIARQLIEASQVDVILGGGEDRWLPAGSPGAYPDNPPADPEEQSQSDKGDLIARAEALGYAYVSDAAGLAAATGPKLLGLFANEEMFQQFPEGQGDVYAPVVSLEAMTAKAIEILSQDPDGFFLFVEEEAIDEMAHRNNAALTIAGVQALDLAVAQGVAYAEATPDTLLVVTADHETGGLAIEEAVENPEFPDESGVAGEGTEALSGEDGPFAIAGSGYQFKVDWTTTGHTGLPVPVTAMGPGAERLTGFYENTYVFEVLVAALGLELPAGIPATPVPGIPGGTPAAGATPVG